MIVSATSDRQANAIADSIAEAVKKAGGGKSRTEEGTGGWALLDFGDVVVHVFVDESRAFYDIDQLWSDVPRIAVPALTSPLAAAAGPSALAQRKRNVRG